MRMLTNMTYLSDLTVYEKLDYSHAHVTLVVAMKSSLAGVMMLGAFMRAGCGEVTSLLEIITKCFLGMS